MQKSTAVIIVVAALLVLGGLLFHGRRIGQLSDELADLRRQNAALDTHIQELTAELPNVGRNAGREAVAGVMDEVLSGPLEMLRSQLPQLSGGIAFASGQRSAPLFHLEIEQPSVSIHLNTDVGLSPRKPRSSIPNP